MTCRSEFFLAPCAEADNESRIGLDGITANRQYLGEALQRLELLPTGRARRQVLTKRLTVRRRQLSVQECRVERLPSLAAHRFSFLP